jgi:hypothetical protein
MMFVGKPGRKCGYVHEDMVWQNIYATNETDVETLEAMFIEKSQTFEEARLISQNVKLLQNVNADRSDFECALAEFGFSAEKARAQAENTEDLIPFPLGGYKVRVDASVIEGRGLFATAPIQPGEVIAPARIAGKRTPAGRYTNHAATPNARMVKHENGDIDLVALRPILGCKGGLIGDEITIDYRQALRLSLPEGSPCQQ